MNRLIPALLTTLLFACGGPDGPDAETNGDRLTQDCDIVCVTEPCECPPPSCDLECGMGEHCELEAVYCFAPPCDPQPVCVPDCDLACDEGERCELQAVYCFAPPCDPQPLCVPED